MKVAQFYKGHVSGWLLAIVAIGLDIAAAYFVDDPSKSAKVIRWSAWLTSAAAIWLVFVAQYDAWKDEFEKREARRLRIFGHPFKERFLISWLLVFGGKAVLRHTATQVSHAVSICVMNAPL